MKVLGLIPTRLGSTRLPAKALLKLNGMPLIIHTYKRSKLAKKLNDFLNEQKISCEIHENLYENLKCFFKFFHYLAC